jgi:hypothetical protein
VLQGIIGFAVIIAIYQFKRGVTKIKEIVLREKDSINNGLDDIRDLIKCFINDQKKTTSNDDIISTAETNNILRNSELPEYLITEWMLQRENHVAEALCNIIEEAQIKISEAIAKKDYGLSENIINKLNSVLEKNLLRCDAKKLGHIYKKAFQTILEADEKVITAIGLLDSAEQAVNSFPKRLLIRVFSEEQLQEAYKKMNEDKRVIILKDKCNELSKEIVSIDLQQADAIIQLSSIELRLGQLIANSNPEGKKCYLTELFDLLAIAKITNQFYSKLYDNKLSVEEIRTAFLSLASIQDELSSEIIKGSVFEKIDKSLSICSFYFAICAELGKNVLPELSGSITQKEFIELKSYVSDTQYRIYNAWALGLITETKVRYKQDMKLLGDNTGHVRYWFKEVFTKIDESMLNHGVSKLFYDFHSKLIDDIKKNYDVVKELLSEEMNASKISIYKLHE